jgi:hypothetical protein
MEAETRCPYSCRKSNRGRPLRSLITILTELSRLLQSMKSVVDTYMKGSGGIQWNFRK